MTREATHPNYDTDEPSAAIFGWLGIGTIGIMISIILSTATPVEASAVETTQQAGKIFTKTIKQEFGSQQVLAATIDRNPRSSADFIYIEVESMPCVVYHPDDSDSRSLTCDWSRWEGRSFSEAQEPNPSKVQKIIDDYKKLQLPQLPQNNSVGVLR